MRKSISGIQHDSGCSYEEAKAVYDRQEREHNAKLEIMRGRATKIACRAIGERDHDAYLLMKEVLGDMLDIGFEKN